MKNKVLFCLYNFLLIILALFVSFINFSVFTVKFWSVLLIFLIICSGSLSICFAIFNKNKSLSKLFFVSNFICTVVLIICVIFKRTNILEIFSSIASFKEFILSTKEKGMIIYVLIQFIQVLSVPIPSMIITLTGVAIYGPLLGAILCTLGVLLGSYASFFVGKVFGVKIVKWIVGEEKAIRYANIIEKKGKFFLIIAFLLPLFPDDILCLISGLTTMKFKTFFWIALITRPIGVICMSYFGGGYIVPFTGWGLFVWPIILIVAVLAVVILTKYQEKIEEWVLLKLNKVVPKKEKDQ